MCQEWNKSDVDHVRNCRESEDDEHLQAEVGLSRGTKIAVVHGLLGTEALLRNFVDVSLH